MAAKKAPMKSPAKKPAPKNPFENTKRDVEVPGHGKEGSKKEEAFDRTQRRGK
jgi:hypothetical protein